MKALVLGGRGDTTSPDYAYLTDVGASLIGRHAQVMPAPRVPQVHRLVLGDHSVVQISS